MEYNKIIFVAQTGTCREAMAAGIFGDFALKHPLEIQTRGLVVQWRQCRENAFWNSMRMRFPRISMYLPSMWAMNWKYLTRTEAHCRRMDYVMKHYANQSRNL